MAKHHVFRMNITCYSLMLIIFALSLGYIIYMLHIYRIPELAHYTNTTYEFSKYIDGVSGIFHHIASDKGR